MEITFVIASSWKWKWTWWERDKERKLKRKKVIKGTWGWRQSEIRKIGWSHNRNGHFLLFHSISIHQYRYRFFCSLEIPKKKTISFCLSAPSAFQSLPKNHCADHFRAHLSSTPITLWVFIHDTHKWYDTNVNNNPLRCVHVHIGI